MTRPFLDTNVFLRHLVFHPEHSPAATSFFERVESGATKVQTSTTAVFESVFTLERRYKVPREQIAPNLLLLLSMPGVHLSGKRLLNEVFDLYLALPRLSFADAYHAVLARRHAGGHIVSFDTDFDHVPKVTRIDPLGLTRSPSAA